MPKRHLVFGVISVLLALLLSACAGGEPAPATADQAASTVTVYKSPT